MAVISRASTRRRLRSVFAPPAVRLRSLDQRTTANTSEYHPASPAFSEVFARVRWPSRFSKAIARTGPYLNHEAIQGVERLHETLRLPRR